ncbi:glycosyltransferase family A protein [Desertimonas flava]|uniref:glycosyltransferase family A protein n=1 Tax=Desertimonas flava TaxID=2064846 RepID=UPI001D0CDCC5|nr:glycosyltransferase family A protein [Desertimonas flava]
MSGPTFSFLTTAYGTEDYIADTIESVLAQTRGDWELIVVDNGPSAEMARIVESYAAADERIMLIRQDNRGYRGGVAAAAAEARGDFVSVLDSDDLLLPEFCARVGAVLDSNPAVDAVGVDAYRFNGDDGLDLPVPYMRSIGVSEPADPSNRLSLTDVLGGRVPYYTAAVRRTAWEAVGGYEPGVDDVDESVVVWCRLVVDYDVRLIPDRLARYRLRGDSLSRDPAKVENFERQLMRSFIEGARTSNDPADRQALDTTLRRMRYHQAIRRARTALLAGDDASARSEARAAFNERASARSAVLLATLTVAPGLMRRLHPLKARVSQVVTGAVARIVAGRRRSAGTRG